MPKCHLCGRTDERLPLYNMIGYTGFKGKYWCLKCIDRQSVEVSRAISERFNINISDDELKNVAKFDIHDVMIIDRIATQNRLEYTINNLRSKQQFNK